MNLILAIIEAWPRMSDAWQFVFLVLFAACASGVLTVVYVCLRAIDEWRHKRAMRRRIYWWRYK